MSKKGGAMSWPVWTLQEARRQQQLELFTLRSVDPRKQEAKRIKRQEQRRRRRRAGVYVP